MERELISIVIPCYNQGHYIQEALSSLEKSNSELFEVIIVNESPTDSYTIARYKIIQFTGIYLKHFLGTQKHAGYFSVFKKLGRSLHSPFRIYYMIRNFLYVSSKYKKQLPEEMKKRRKGLFIILKNNLLFSGQFLKVLVAAIKGYLHFKFNRFSS